MAKSKVESDLYKLINNGLFGMALMSGGKDVLEPEIDYFEESNTYARYNEDKINPYLYASDIKKKKIEDWKNKETQHVKEK